MLCASLPGVALAQSLPDYDPGAFCQNVASENAQEETDQLLYEGCMRREEADRADIGTGWSDVPAAVRDYCTRAKPSGSPGSYSILKRCVRSEIGATPPPARELGWYLRTPDGSAPYGSLLECSDARARSKATWAVCSNQD
jgi:hypothetical protein